VEITNTTTIDAPIASVWAATLDIETLPASTPTVTHVERLDSGPVQVGSRARLTQPGLPPRIWTVEELDAPHRFVWATRLLGVRMVGIHELASAGDGRCLLTLRVRFEGRGAWLLGGLGRRSIARSLTAEGAGFAAAAVATT
jgi:ligand-binding SRPBCC domain-containing protein